MINTCKKKLLSYSLLSSSIHSHPYTDRSNPLYEEGRKESYLHACCIQSSLFAKAADLSQPTSPAEQAQLTVYLNFGWSHSLCLSRTGTAQVCTKRTSNLYEENNGRSFQWISAWTPYEKHKGNSMHSPLKYQLALFLPFRCFFVIVSVAKLCVLFTSASKTKLHRGRAFSQDISKI